MADVMWPAQSLDHNRNILDLLKGMKPNRAAEPPDGGYGWVVLSACVVCQGTVNALQKTSGLVFVEIIEYYHVNRTEAFLVLVLCKLFAFIFAPVVGKLLTKVDYSIILCVGSLLLSISLMLTACSTQYWQLLIAYGILQGLGTNLVMASCSLTAGLYFEKRRSLAMGLYYSASGVIGLISPILFNRLLEIYEFHGAILIFGAISLHSCACGMLVRQPTWVVHKRKEELVELVVKPTDIVDNKTESELLSPTCNNNGAEKTANCNDICEKSETILLTAEESEKGGVRTASCFQTVAKDIREDLRLFKDGHFLIQLFNRGLLTITLAYFLSLLPDFVEGEIVPHVSKQEVAFILSMSSIGDIIVRLVTGVMLDKLPWAKKYSLCIITVLIGVTVLAFQFMHTYTHLVIGSVFYGLWTGMALVVQYLVEMDLMGPQRIHMANGLNRFTVGFGTVIVGLVVGHLRDKLGSYKLCITVLGGTAILGGLVWLAEPLIIKCFPVQYQQKTEDTNDETHTVEA